MSRTVLASFVVAAITIGCQKKPVEIAPPDASALPHSPAATAAVSSLEPPKSKRGQPVLFPEAEYDQKRWRGKTNPVGMEWFKTEKEGWYIDWDDERKQFDMLVIHHTATGPNATPEEIDAIQKERLYVPRYKSENNEPFVKGLPIHSSHVVNGKERFIGYHHLVYADGKVTTELAPLINVEGRWYIDHVGWHSGKWSVNCRSIAICLVGDFSDKEPPDTQLRATAGLIVHYRTFNPQASVTSHGDHAGTECPGKTWRMWKPRLLALSGIVE